MRSPCPAPGRVEFSVWRHSSPSAPRPSAVGAGRQGGTARHRPTPLRGALQQCCTPAGRTPGGLSEGEGRRRPLAGGRGGGGRQRRVPPSSRAGAPWGRSCGRFRAAGKPGAGRTATARRAGRCAPGAGEPGGAGPVRPVAAASVRGGPPRCVHARRGKQDYRSRQGKCHARPERRVRSRPGGAPPGRTTAGGDRDPRRQAGRQGRAAPVAAPGTAECGRARQAAPTLPGDHGEADSADRTRPLGSTASHRWRPPSPRGGAFCVRDRARPDRTTKDGATPGARQPTPRPYHRGPGVGGCTTPRPKTPRFRRTPAPAAPAARRGSEDDRTRRDRCPPQPDRRPGPPG